MREIVQKEDCVIVGRCADFILENDDVNLLSVFVTASLEYRVNHLMEINHLNKRQALAQAKKIDKRRESYYHYFTKREWKDAKHYDLLLNSQRLGFDKCTKLLCDSQHTHIRNQIVATEISFRDFCCIFYFIGLGCPKGEAL